MIGTDCIGSCKSNYHTITVAFFILAVNGLMIGAAVESALTKTTSGQAFNYVGWTFYLCGCGGILALITAILFIIHLYLAVYY
jgi:hypothetical protein